jgi:type I restriction enzyme S subunit
MGLGKVVRAPFATAINQDLKALFPADGVEKSFLEYWLLSISNVLEGMGTGTTVKGIRLGDITSLPFPLPPHLEQQRIVEKIETLFARLDKGEEAVRRVQALLKRYRQSVLKAAVAGNLTAEWREANLYQLEHGRDLLARILKTRRESWKDRGHNQKLTAPDLSELPELPEGWVWANMGQLAKVLGGLTKNAKRKDLPTKVPMLRVANVYQGRLDLTEIHETGISPNELARVSMKTGDILVVEGNGSQDQIGRMAIWNSEIEGAVHQNHLIKARLAIADLGPFILTWFGSFDGRRAIERVASSTSGLYTLSISKIELLAVPLPPLEEVAEVQAQVDEALSKMAVLEDWCAAELVRSAALRQSILKQAFAGRLVPQDPSDEPASALLARIRATDSKKKIRKAG